MGYQRRVHGDGIEKNEKVINRLEFKKIDLINFLFTKSTLLLKTAKNLRKKLRKQNREKKRENREKNREKYFFRGFFRDFFRGFENQGKQLELYCKFHSLGFLHDNMLNLEILI